jgi:hypothetical protein
MILDQMEMLDQQIAPARPVGEQRAHFYKCLRIDLPALWGARRAATATPRNSGIPLGLVGCDAHLKVLVFSDHSDLIAAAMAVGGGFFRHSLK